jgi:hypothetical protein
MRRGPTDKQAILGLRSQGSLRPPRRSVRPSGPRPATRRWLAPKTRLSASIEGSDPSRAFIQWLDAVAPRSVTTNFWYVGEESISYYAAGFSTATVNLLTEASWLVPDGPYVGNYYPYPSAYQQLVMGVVDDSGLDSNLVIPAPIVAPGLDGTGNNCIVNEADLVSPTDSNLYYTLVTDVQNYANGPSSGFPAHLYLQGQVLSNYYQQLTSPFWYPGNYLWWVAWVDILGQECTTYWCQEDGVTQNILDDLQAMSNAGQAGYMAAPMQYQPYGIATEPPGYNVTDKAVLQFATGSGARLYLTLPAPTAGCIKPDGTTVDASYCALVISACLGVLSTPSGDVAAAYTGGRLAKRSAQ